MARFRSRTLQWKAVESKEVAGYKIYWSKSNKVTYDSESVYVRDLTEIAIPNALEGFVPEPGIYMFGITSVDQWGNESDITTLKEPFNFAAPTAPASLWVETIAGPSAPDAIWLDPIEKTIIGERKKALDEKNINPGEFSDIDESKQSMSQKFKNQQSMKYYDDIGFRKI